MSVVANESVALECQSHAVPPPVLSWRKDGRPLEPGPGVRLSADKALLEVRGLPRKRSGALGRPVLREPLWASAQLEGTCRPLLSPHPGHVLLTRQSCCQPNGDRTEPSGPPSGPP